MTATADDHEPDPDGAPPVRVPRDLSGLSELVGLDPPEYRRQDMERLVGVDHEEMVRWWRAMGFAEVPETEVAFGQNDVEMARRLVALVGSDLLADGDILRLARLLGASFSRIAEAQAGVLDEVLLALPPPSGDTSPWERISALEADPDTSILALLEDSLVYVWRRHLVAALGRWLDAEEDVAEHAVGFADISGFSKLTRDLPADELAELVDTFETTAFDVVSARAARVVKLIGDEVMFVAEDLETGVEIGLELTDRLAALDQPVDLHCGVAFGPTITVGGDVFGPTVNLASRLTDVARRGKVVVPREDAERFEDRTDLEVHRVRRVFDLKGIGRARLVTVARRAVPEPEADPEPGTAPGPEQVPGGTGEPGEDPPKRTRKSRAER
jgi:adenylate cyclase